MQDDIWVPDIGRTDKGNMFFLSIIIRTYGAVGVKVFALLISVLVYRGANFLRPSKQPSVGPRSGLHEEKSC
jgi:hypothetical protein